MTDHTEMLSQVVADIATELDCEPDNEVILLRIASLRQQLTDAKEREEAAKLDLQRLTLRKAEVDRFILEKGLLHELAASLPADHEYNRLLRGEWPSPASPAPGLDMVLVPREPTNLMLLEGYKAADVDDLDLTQEELANIYLAMIAATPSPSGDRA